MNKLQIAVLSGGVGLCINGYLGIRAVKELDKTIEGQDLTIQFLKDVCDDYLDSLQKTLELVDDPDALRKVLEETEFERVVKYGAREDNTPYSETPTKGFKVSPTIMKHVVKTAVGLAGAAVLGYTYRTEKNVQQRISDHYDNVNTEEPTTEEPTV